MDHKSSKTLWGEAPPLIGRCAQCHMEIFASHPYPWCTNCNHPIPYGINMQRRPIMYGTIQVSPSSLAAIDAVKPRQR